MTISKLLLSTSVLAVMALPALAQERTFRSIDTNRNGVLERGELEEAFGSGGATTVLSRSDSDGDGKVTRKELRQSRDDESDDEKDDRRDDENDDRDDDENDDRSDDENDDRSDDENDDRDDDENDDRSDDENDDRDDDEGDDDRGSDESDDEDDD
ncbi:EF-hand domain-containing protein [Tropicimonas sp. IMCC6043]|uniref:EF-hand domain-containing protein n=1 Tax=Tropicimonas sp. IMCC6043 TaxID=2510645 RepID=UPI00101C2A82|nr:EF-hand domain-containing protein [Tropicimonas sp. IMCC6043]RYH08819.1 EF-hand domain-containing protein [Tropicimonas sp. IMCC6043]